MTTTAHQATTRTYMWIWVWLAGLMLVSVVLSESHLLPLSPAALVAIVLGLSTIKALLVALYYMHLKIDAGLLKFVAIFPLIVIGLAVFVVYSSRFVRL